MEVIVVCHTESGFVQNKRLIFSKKAISGVAKGVKNLIKIAEKYSAKVTFAVCPEVVEYFPKHIKHEVGLHIHPGWEEGKYQGYRYYVGDAYLKQHCPQTKLSTVLWDYSYKEQKELIMAGKDHIMETLGIKPKSFVAGRWSENNDTHKALVDAGITHDCSPNTSNKANHFDWSKLPRICMPYYPSPRDYQKEGDLSLLVIPISQYYPRGNVTPEHEPVVGLAWLKACFLEYKMQNLPLFHICLHSPSMVDSHYIQVMDKLLNFISNHKVEYKFASDIKYYEKPHPKMKVLPYLLGINKNILRSFLLSKVGDRIEE